MLPENVPSADAVGTLEGLGPILVPNGRGGVRFRSIIGTPGGPLPEWFIRETEGQELRQEMVMSNAVQGQEPSPELAEEVQPEGERIIVERLQREYFIGCCYMARGGFEKLPLPMLMLCYQTIGRTMEQFVQENLDYLMKENKD